MKRTNPVPHRLSKRQAAILTFIREHTLTFGYPPSIRSIGDAVELSSSSTVHSHLRTLEAKGYLRRKLGQPRSIQLVDTPPSVPLVERLARLEALVREGVEAWQAYEPGTEHMTEWAARAAAVVCPEMLPAGVAASA